VNLLLLERHEVSPDGEVTLRDGRAAHLRSVLRVRRAQPVRVGLVDGPCGRGIVADVGERAVTLQCIFEAETPPRPRIDLLLAVPRPKVLNRLWAQLAALGVGQIILTNAEKVERPYFDTHVLDPAHYRPLLIEGLQQACDTRMPLVSVHRQFRILIEDELEALFPEGVRLMADPSASQLIDSAARKRQHRLLLAVGPEGGWNDFERSLLAAHGFEAVTMGRRTLRSDTACIALLALAHRVVDSA
jgi:16S rRNA (uracil1498-N3)-methyltransferase